MRNPLLPCASSTDASRTSAFAVYAPFFRPAAPLDAWAKGGNRSEGLCDFRYVPTSPSSVLHFSRCQPDLRQAQTNSEIYRKIIIVSI